MLLPIAYKKSDVRIQKIGELLVKAINSSLTDEITDDFLVFVSSSIGRIAREFETLEEFDRALDAAESSLNFECIHTEIGDGITEQLIESFEIVSKARVRAYRALFIMEGYPNIFDKWSLDNNTDEIISTRYIFDCRDLSKEYETLYTEFIRLCARLRNRTPNPEIEGSDIKYREDFTHCKLLTTRLRSFEMISDSKEKY